MIKILNRLIELLFGWHAIEPQEEPQEESREEPREIQNWKKMTLVDIDAMRANEFQKDEFRQMLANAESAGLVLGCSGKLTPDGLSFVIIDPIDQNGVVSDVCFGPNHDELGMPHYDSVIGAKSMKELSGFLELRAGSVMSGSGQTLAMTTEMALRHNVEMLGGRMSCDGEVVRYYRSEILGIWEPNAFLDYRKPDFIHYIYEYDSLREVLAEVFYEFSLPRQMGALLNLITHDMETLPAHLRKIGLCAPVLDPSFVKATDKLSPGYQIAVDRILNGGYY